MQAKSIVDDIFKDIVDAAASGAEVSLPGFGKFKVKATPQREGRNPANREKIKIAASKKLTFSSAKPLPPATGKRARHLTRTNSRYSWAASIL